MSGTFIRPSCRHRRELIDKSRVSQLSEHEYSMRHDQTEDDLCTICHFRTDILLHVRALLVFNALFL